MTQTEYLQKLIELCQGQMQVIKYNHELQLAAKQKDLAAGGALAPGRAAVSVNCFRRSARPSN